MAKTISIRKIKMKTLLFLSLVAFANSWWQGTVVMPVEQLEGFIPISDKCGEKSTIGGEKFIYDMFENKLEKDENTLKHMICLFKEIGILQENGKGDYKGYKELLTNIGESRADEIRQKCLIDKNTTEETAWNVYKCWYSLKTVVLPEKAE